MLRRQWQSCRCPEPFSHAAFAGSQGMLACHRQSAQMGAPAVVRERQELPCSSTAIAAVVQKGGSWLERFSNYIKQIHAKWVHRLEWIQEMIVDDPRFDACTVGGWALWHKDWDALGPERQLRYQLQVGMARDIVKPLLGAATHVQSCF